MELVDRGSGPPVVLLHGAPSPPGDFQRLADDLAADHRVLIPSLPGYGASPPLAPYSFDAVEHLLVDALRERGVTRAALVGMSGGAYRALRMATHGFGATAIVCLGGTAWTAPEEAPILRGFSDLARSLPDFKDPAIREMFANRMLSPPWRAAHPETVATVAAWLDATTPAVLADELAAFAALDDLRPALAHLDVVVTVRTGSLDVATPPAMAESIATACPHARLQIVPGCGHALLVEDEAASIAAIRAAVA